MTHSELVDAAYKWVLKRGSCGVAFKELRSLAQNGEYPDVIGFGSGNSTVIECKVSRADFLADLKKSFRAKPELGMGKFRYYCCPTGLIKEQELPIGWGLLYADRDMKVRRIHNPYGTIEGNIRANGMEYNLQSEHQLMYSVLRRLFIRGLIKHVYEPGSRTENSDELIEDNAGGS